MPKAGGKWSPEHRAAYEKAIAKRRKAKDDEVKALIAANQDKTKKELGISGWKAFDGSDGGYNARFLRNARVGVDLPPIDLRDTAQVAERIEMYFDHCEQTEVLPNLIGLANWLGVNRSTLDRWKRGDFSPDKSPLIQRAISIIEEALVSQVQGEKKNPASGIFLMKSIFHYREQQDIVISAGRGDEAAMSADEIAKRYLGDGKIVDGEIEEDGDA